MKITLPQLLGAIKNRFGIEQFRSVQEPVITSLLQRRNVLAIMPTGSGKSLTYQGLAFVSSGVVVVVEPFIALIRDQLTEASKYGVPAASLHSDMTENEKSQLAASIKAKQLKLLYVTPERFDDDDFRALCCQLNVLRFVIDEAHCVHSMGDGFRPAYAKLGGHIGLINNVRINNGLSSVPMLFLSGTMSEKAILRIRQSFEIDDLALFQEKRERDNLKIEIRRIPSSEKVVKVIELARRTLEYGSMLVYVSDKQTAAILLERMKLRGLPVKLFHASLTAAEKQSNLLWFKNTDKGLLISTSALSAGFNKDNIRTVVHYHPPRSVEEYAQEIGRAGRDGKVADAVLFYDPVSDSKLNSALMKNSAPDLKFIAAFAFMINSRIASGDYCMSISIERIKLEYGLHDLTAGAFRTLLIQAKSAGALDFKEADGVFDVAIFGPVSNDALLALLNNNENTEGRYQAMQSLIATAGCKHDVMANYFGNGSGQVRSECSCCYRFAVKPLNVRPSVLRGQLLKIRSSVSKRYGVPAFALLPSEAIELIIQIQPSSLDELVRVAGFDDLRRRTMGNAILAAIQLFH
jgi:RecQ family ATP-dependent DNA helicase